mgnify:CR=1 FL=1
MIDESVLIQRAQLGEAEAFGALVSRYQATVFNVCLRLLGDRGEAEDATQEAFVRAYQRLATFDRQRAFAPWMRTVAANHCYNKLESRCPCTVDYDQLAERTAPMQISPESQVLQEETSRQVRQAMLALPHHFRLVIELRHFQELNYEEIAATTGLSLSVVKTNLFRARKLLAEIITKTL